MRISTAIGASSLDAKTHAVHARRVTLGLSLAIKPRSRRVTAMINRCMLCEYNGECLPSMTAIDVSRCPWWKLADRWYPPLILAMLVVCFMFSVRLAYGS